MRPASIGRVIILSWLAAEFLAYLVFFSLFPVWAGLAIGVGSTGLGVLGLRLLGAQAMRAVTAQLANAASGVSLRMIPFALLGAVLLILPGFLSDFIGLALLIAGSAAILRRREPAAARNIDLEQHEWTRLPDDGPSR